MPIPDLPLDVLDVICQFVDQCALVALASSCSTFYPFAQRHLYHRIALPTAKSTVRCLKTLRKRPELARHVRFLSLRMDPSTTVFRPFVHLLASGIASLINLVSLDVVVPHSASRALFAAQTNGSIYTRLVHFSCNLPLDEPMCSFLQCLPMVKEIQLGEYAASLSPPVNPRPIPRLLPSALPNLAFFMGPSDAAMVLVPGRPLESVHLYPGELSEEVLDALSRASSPITVLGAFTHSLSPSTLQCLADTLPRLHFLRIMTMYHASSPPDESFYTQVVQILSTLPELVGAELAGFRWFSVKDAASADGHAKPNAVSAHVTSASILEGPSDEDIIDIGLY